MKRKKQFTNRADIRVVFGTRESAERFLSQFCPRALGRTVAWAEGPRILREAEHRFVLAGRVHHVCRNDGATRYDISRFLREAAMRSGVVPTEFDVDPRKPIPA